MRLENTPGALAQAARFVASAGINIEYLYATAQEGETSAAVIVGVEDPRRAATAIGI